MKKAPRAMLREGPFLIVRVDLRARRNDDLPSLFGGFAVRGIINRCVVIGLLMCASFARAEESFYVVVYGGTSGGVIAAVQAGGMGKTAVLGRPGQHLGGKATGGMGATGMGNQEARRGGSRAVSGALLRH